MNFGPQNGLKSDRSLYPPSLFCSVPSSYTLYAALTWRLTATLNETALAHLQLSFEAPNTIASGGLKWQYIAIIATFSSYGCSVAQADNALYLMSCLGVTLAFYYLPFYSHSVLLIECLLTTLDKGGITHVNSQIMSVAGLCCHCGVAMP